ncbi:MAG: hypothetical protein QW403_02135 [Candidatus Aenigmatarchaeota archaeon]
MKKEVTFLFVSIFFLILISKVSTNIGEFYGQNEIIIEKQDYIDTYFNWTFTEINSTHWFASFLVESNLWNNITYCESLDLIQKSQCWQNVKDTFFPEYDLTTLTQHLTQLLDGTYPLINLTRNIAFSDFEFNLTGGKASFYIIFPEGFKAGEKASFGFNSTRIFTIKRYDKIRSREKEPFKIYQIDSFELKMDKDSYKRYDDYYNLTVNFETIPEDKIVHYYGGLFSLDAKDFRYFFVTNTTKIEKGSNSLSLYYPLPFLEPGEYQIVAFYYFEGEYEHYYVESNIFKVVE